MADGPDLRNAAYACGPRGSVLDRLTVGYAGATFDGFREPLDPPDAALRASRAPWVFREERHRITVRFLAGIQDSGEEIAACLIEALHLGGAEPPSRRARRRRGLPGIETS